MGRPSAEARPRGAVWRRLHRWIGSVALVLLALIAVTGVTLQVEMMQTAAPAPPAGGGGTAPSSASYSDEQVLAMVRTTLAAAHRADPASPPMELSLQLGARPTGTVTLRAATPQRHGFDARTGAPIGGSGEDGARAFHLLLLRLHRGDIAGAAGLWISIACGLALLTLCLTGAWVYVDLWRRRAARGERGLFWT